MFMKGKWKKSAGFILFLFSSSLYIKGAVIQVGPNRTIKTCLAAAAAAQDGDTVEIDAGTYLDEAAIAVWRSDNIVLRAVGGPVHLHATRQIPYNGTDLGNGKGIWVLLGGNTTIEGIEFSGAAVPDLNGAGIRIQPRSGSDIRIRNCIFHDNEDGILTGSDFDLLVEYSEFNGNGHGDGYSHNMYINRCNRFTLRYCYVHHAHIGHNVKSRARESRILYNRIMDESDGDSSYAVDACNGGLVYIIGNLIQQGPLTDNSTMLIYGEEGLPHALNEWYIVNNTIVNDRSGGNFIRGNGGASRQFLRNNLLIGNGTTWAGGVFDADASNIIRTEDSYLVDRNGYDYHLTPGAVLAIDGGVNPGSGQGFPLSPEYQYLHNSQSESRPVSGAIDIGAYEWTDAIAAQTIDLGTGWNWISFNVLPDDRSLGTIFSGIIGQIEQVKSQMQSVLRYNGQWLGDLQNMDGIQQGMMYKVRVNAPCTLTISGTRISANTPIQLDGGWNWIAFYPSTLQPINETMSSIANQAQQAKSQAQSAIRSNGQWFGDLQQMEPGKGYSILMASSAVLIYSE